MHDFSPLASLIFLCVFRFFLYSTNCSNFKLQFLKFDKFWSNFKHYSATNKASCALCFRKTSDLVSNFFRDTPFTYTKMFCNCIFQNYLIYQLFKAVEVMSKGVHQFFWHFWQNFHNKKRHFTNFLVVVTIFQKWRSSRMFWVLLVAQT